MFKPISTSPAFHLLSLNVQVFYDRDFEIILQLHLTTLLAHPIKSIPDIQICLLLSDGNEFAQQKKPDHLFRQPGFLHEIRSFPSPPHDGFGFSLFVLPCI
jgi:hypothetical protein